tara:strand:+ start:139 stop:630 length:492 start_codon:yes stop_codon:yes gene_type:complete
VNIKQFKLTNNEEIVCEVIEWNTGDDVADVVIKKALRVISVEDYQRGWKFFAFRPWMSFQEDPTSLQTLNSSHIIVTSNPSPDLLKHYKACLRGLQHDMKKFGNRRKTYANLDEISDAMRDLTDEEMDRFLEEKYGAMVKDDKGPDSSDNGNIIKFKPKGTLH